MTHPLYHRFADLPLGRKPRRLDGRTLRLAPYLDATVLPEIPDNADLTVAVGGDWPMYGNDEEGDCTCAAAGHMVEGWTAGTSVGLVKPADGQIQSLYWETGDPPAASGAAGGPTDTGRVEIDVLNYWRQNGLDGQGAHPITAYMAVDPASAEMMRAAIYLFGGVYTGIALPKSAQQQHTVWDVDGDPKDQGSPAAPGSWGGHAVPFLAYDKDGFTCVTWGATMRLTNAFNAAYTEEAYAIISPDWFTAGKTPQGFDIDQLQADLHKVTGG